MVMLICLPNECGNVTLDNPFYSCMLTCYESHLVTFKLHYHTHVHNSKRQPGNSATTTKCSLMALLVSALLRLYCSFSWQSMIIIRAFQSHSFSSPQNQKLVLFNLTIMVNFWQSYLGIVLCLARPRAASRAGPSSYRPGPARPLPLAENGFWLDLAL